MEKICPICNKIFITKTNRTIYCSENCRKEMQKFRLKQKNLNKRLTGKQCIKCGKTFIPKQYGSTRRYCFDCIPDGLSTGAEIRRQVKKWGLEYKGAICSRCGYNKCVEALEFHHKDMSDKEFNISDRNLILDWPKIKAELDKCDVVCANCHREIHAEIYNKEGDNK